MKVAFLGPRGTYTHEAVIQQFGNDENLSLYPQSTIDACFEALNSEGEVDYAVVPFENSTNGQVVFTYDLLRDWFIEGEDHSTPQFKIVGEQYVSIHHYLSSKATDISDIKTIYSHPQVWGQVSKFLKSTSGCKRVDVNSTAEAARIVSEDETRTSACISSKTGAELHHLRILQAKIEDIPDNTTRFLILGRKEIKTCSSPVEQKDESVNQSGITSVMFTLNHNDPGALMSALDSFRSQNINLTSIASRPSKRNQWHYVFFVEAEGSIKSDRMRLSISGLQKCCTNVVVLGSFIRSRRQDST